MFRCFGKQKNISLGGFNESHKLQYFSVKNLPPLESRAEYVIEKAIKKGILNV